MKDLISLMKCAPALQSANIELTTGVKLRYVEQGDPKGQVIIMLHGYSDSWFSYSTILKLISAKYRVYVLEGAIKSVTRGIITFTERRR